MSNKDDSPLTRRELKIALWLIIALFALIGLGNYFLLTWVKP